MKNIITKEKVEKYLAISSKAFEIAKSSIVKSKKKEAKEILIIVKCYLNDSMFFMNKKDYVNAFACINYSHGWLDCGARLKIFYVKDNRLFSV